MLLPQTVTCYIYSPILWCDPNYTREWTGSQAILKQQYFLTKWYNWKNIFNTRDNIFFCFIHSRHQWRCNNKSGEQQAKRTGLANQPYHPEMQLYSFITQLLTFTLASGTLLWNWALTPLSTTDFGDSVGYKPSKLTSKTKLRSNDAALNPPETVRSFFTTVVDGSDLAWAGFLGWVGGEGHPHSHQEACPG